MKKINRRKLLKLMGLTAVTLSTSTLICRDCAIAYESVKNNGELTRTRCPHRYCMRYQPPEEGINEKEYSIYTADEGFCLSKAFEGRPRI